MIKKLFLLLLVLVIFSAPLFAPGVVFAQYWDTYPSGNPPDAPGNGTTEGPIKNPLGFDSIPKLIEKLLQIVVQIGTPIVALMIVIVGLMFVLARGNPEQLKTAKDALKWTLIGAAIVLGAYVISSALEETVTSITK